MDLWDRLREKLGFKESAVTGLNWGRNVLKLVGVVVVPFYVIWGVSQWSYYVWNVGEMMVTMQLAIGLSFWGSGIYGYMAHVKNQAASMLSFPASKWRFNETQVSAIDLVLPEGSIEYIGRLKRNNGPESPEDGDPQGFYVYRLTFPFLIGYNHPTKGILPFYRCYWLTPAEWEKQFYFRQGGEIWYGGFPISHPKAEDVSLHVYPYHRWEVNKRELLPVCLVHDSKLHYQATMNKLPERLAQQLGEKPGPDDIQRAKESALIKENIELKGEAETVEGELESKLNESFSIKDVRKKMLADHKRRYGHVLRAEEPWRWKLLNLKVLGFVALIVIAAVVVYSFYLAPMMG